MIPHPDFQRSTFPNLTWSDWRASNRFRPSHANVPVSVGSFSNFSSESIPKRPIRFLLSLHLWIAAVLFALVGSLGRAAENLPVPSAGRVSLSGEWKFTADYQNAGDAAQWFTPAYGDGVWDTVQVPHTWSHDPRFMGFIGAGWYRRKFTAPTVAEGEHVRLVFGAVFARARVWLNGQLLGSHDGGYTPFEFDLGAALKPGASNLIVVCADNRWDATTSPGARGTAQPPELVYAWWDDGGIIRDVELRVTPAIYISKQKVEAVPDLASGTATVRVRAWVRNTTGRSQRVRLTGELAREGEKLSLAPTTGENEIEIPANGDAVAELGFSLAATQVRLWSMDTPVLYQARTQVGGHAADSVNFGLRRFVVRGEQLLLNGHPVRLAGANWHASHPEWGQNQPAEGVIRDLQLMKEGGFVFQRLAHYPVSPVILDWADRHGMLLIAEASNTGWKANQLGSLQMQEKFRTAHREMVERDWNHASIVAWSVGNEFASDTPEGVRWVQDMGAFTRELDPTRLVTFVSNSVSKSTLKTAGDEGSAYADFVCLNTYGRTPRENAANIDRAHALHPGKPFIITEYGVRHDFVGDETERVDWFREMLAIIRARPFISGASVWSFNDYRSRYVGTNPNGWREWGLVAPDRTPRGSYHALRREHSGFVVREATFAAGTLTVRLESRTDFPVFPPADCELRVTFRDGQYRPLETKTIPIRIGAAMKISAPTGAGTFRAEIWRGNFPTGAFGPVEPAGVR